MKKRGTFFFHEKGVKDSPPGPTRASGRKRKKKGKMGSVISRIEREKRKAPGEWVGLWGKKLCIVDLPQCKRVRTAEGEKGGKSVITSDYWRGRGKV